MRRSTSSATPSPGSAVPKISPGNWPKLYRKASFLSSAAQPFFESRAGATCFFIALNPASVCFGPLSYGCRDKPEVGRINTVKSACGKDS